MGYFDSIKTAEKPLRAVPATPATPLDPARVSRYASKALHSECESVADAPEGQRNHVLNKASFSISQLVAAGHVEHDDAVAALSVAARTAGLDDHEIDATIASGFRAGSVTPRIVPDLPPPPMPTVLIDPATGEVVEEMVGPPLNPILDWHELFASEDDGEEWIVEPILPARRMVALYSAPKAGKSLLMLEIAVAIAIGGEVIGTRVETPQRVLYVDFENDPRGDVRTRLEAMEVGPEQLDNLCYLTFPSLAKFDTAQGALDLIRHVRHYDCQVVVIDTVSRSVGGEENDNDTWLAFYRHTGLLLKQNQIACIRLDHSGKDKEKGMRGGSAKSGDVDAVWRLSLVGEDTVLLECTDNRMPVPAKSLMLTRQSFPLRHVMVGEDWTVLADAKVREVDQRLDALRVPSSASTREAGKALREAGERFENRAIQDAVKLRKLRLDVDATSAPGAPPVQPGTPGGSAPGTPPPLGGVRCTSGGAPGAPVLKDLSEADELVSCKGCHRPTMNGVATRNGGLCATCHRNAGGMS